MFQKKKWFVTGIVLALSLGLAACASKGTDEDPAKKENGKAVEELAPEFTYVAKFGDAPEELKDINRSAICNGKFYALQYYFDSEKNEDHQSLIQYSILKDGLGEGETILDFGGKNESPINFCVDDAGNVYLLKSVWPEGPGESATEAQLNAYYENARKDVNYYLMKYDEQGNQIYEAEFSEETKGEEYFYPQYMAADEKGRVFMGLDQKIWTFDENGKKSGEINLDSQAYIYGLGNGKDNKCYIVYVSYGDTKMNTVFGELDYDAKQIGKKYQNYPAANMGVNSFIKGINSDILCFDGSGVYEYSIEKEESTKLLSWIDCDIDGRLVDTIIPIGDEKIYAIIHDWNAGTTSFAELSKAKTEDVVKKETITMGTIYNNSSLSSKIIEFNKTSDKYRVTLKTYMNDNDWTEESYLDAITELTNELIAGTGPDIMDLTSLDIANLAKKDVLVDLMPYLEKSTKLNKNDIFEKILEGATIDGKLTYIPRNFMLFTLAAKTSFVGDKMGWTIQDVIQFQKNHPDMELMEYLTKEDAFHMMLEVNKDAFIDFEKKECHFDSQEFKDVLAFANSFPEKADYETDKGLLPIRLQKNSLLLENVSLYSFEEIQRTFAYFNEEPVTFIGYPNEMGKNGCILIMTDQYGINSKSSKKDAAWAFLEDIIVSSSEDDNSLYDGFSCLKSKYNEQKQKAINLQPMTDENGEILKDENGNTFYEGYRSSYHMTGENGEEWFYEFKPVTEEQCALVEKLIENSIVLNSSTETDLGTIITEEVAGYFKGDKSLDDVTNIIQNRANLYIKENY